MAGNFASQNGFPPKSAFVAKAKNYKDKYQPNKLQVPILNVGQRGTEAWRPPTSHTLLPASRFDGNGAKR